MNEPGRNTILWVIATFTLAMLPQIASMPLAVFIATLLPLFWRIGSELNNWKPIPALIRHGATISALATLFLSYGNLSGRRSAVSLLTVMLALKLIECYRIRDARLVVCFSLFLCTTQFLFAQGILMPFYAGTTVIIALVALIKLQRSEAWAHAGRAPTVKASLWSELGFSFRLLALAVPVGLAFFVLFPRLSNPLWGIPDTTLDSKSGLSDSMSPGSIQNLFMDDSPAFRAEFTGPVPSAEHLYWRGPVFWRFDGNTWKGGFYGSNVEATIRPEPTAEAWNYTVQLEPNERKWLFALDYPASIPSDARLTMDFQLIRRQPVIQLIQYEIISNPDFIETPDLSDPLRLEALDLPENTNPRTRKLIEDWRRETPADPELIRRVLNHFNEEPFHYSLEAPLLGRHSVDEFLFETRTGFCEHYASSFAVMMRMAGIPARVVTGYQGGWYSAFGNYLLVRQSDAHAWTEVWLPERGWTRVDPTAAVSPLRVQQGSLSALSTPRHFFDYSWLRGFRNSADVMKQRWNDWVIEYGAGRQSKLFAPLGLDHMSPVVLVSVLFLVIAVFSAIVFPIVLRIRGPGHKDPVQQAWQKFLKRMQRAGFEALPSDGAIELAEAASVRLPADSGAIHRIAQLYTKSRYAPDPPPLSDLKQAVQEFRPNKIQVDVR
jgi:transglutaminase-like putative cysteine protease